MDVYRRGESVAIRYEDGNGRRLSRMIEPWEVEVDSYSGVMRVKSFCHLGQVERTSLPRKGGPSNPGEH